MTNYNSILVIENVQNGETMQIEFYEPIQPNTPSSDNECQPLLASLKDQSITVSLWSKLGFALGHIYNDLCGCLWFSYAVLFMTKVLGMNGSEAGALMLFSQIIDALATPISGYLMDKYGTKQKWHIFGSIIVAVTVGLIFSICPMCYVWPSWWRMAYVAITVGLSQIGWPIVQVSHLAMIPEIARKQKDRNQLSSLKNSAQFISYIITFFITFFVLRSGRESANEKTSPHDAYRFRCISLIIAGIGITTTVVFQLSLSFGDYASRLKQSLNKSDANNNQQKQCPQKNFFKSLEMYQNSLMYIFSRILSTLGSVYLPLWLNEVHGVELVALVPLVSYMISFLSSLPMDYLIRCFGNNVMYFAGLVICIIGCIQIEIITSADSSKVMFYLIASCLGAGSSISMVCSLCSIADMVADHSEQSGSVYSIVTTADKLISGVIIMAIQTMHCEGQGCQSHFKYVLARSNEIVVVLGAISLMGFLLFRKICQR